ncbi:hypothetical protein AGOR_G00154360 [Albula goreensis]|uniref:Uncharacterized protein n=1 Tax=Albula goreensis TaxID=1534307 RepID=A0A8T3D3A2_9TELE|nr:hypothetical protein AGOR_G00154360 [Albula goreensis]
MAVLPYTPPAHTVLEQSCSAFFGKDIRLWSVSLYISRLVWEGQREQYRVLDKESSQAGTFLVRIDRGQRGSRSGCVRERE